LSDNSALHYLFKPQPLQEIFLSCTVFEVLFGGGRGAGKSVALLIDFAAHAARYGKNAKGLIIRREATQLRDLLTEARKMFEPIGCVYNSSTKVMRWPNGATLVFDHLFNAEDATGYHGWSLTWLGVEEAGEYPDPGAIDLLRACLRGPVPCYLRLTANPGGPGNGWLKKRFVDPAPEGYKVIEDVIEGQVMQRLYIPCTPYDNPANLKANPLYIAQLRQIGSKELQQAWIGGRWDISIGAYFSDVWYPVYHQLDPFELPKHWRFRRGFDWGYEKPSAMVGCAIPTEDYTFLQSGRRRRIKRGSIIAFRQWYPLARDHKKNEPIYNKGQRRDADEQGEMLGTASLGVNWKGCVADPSIFPDKGQKAIYDDLVIGARKSEHELAFEPADNTRIAGWLGIRAMLRASARDIGEAPGLYVFTSCPDLIRTLPSVQRDRLLPDDIDTDEEDHLLDALRYVANAEGRKDGGGVGKFGG
jgi:hypothetical protein